VSGVAPARAAALVLRLRARRLVNRLSARLLHRGNGRFAVAGKGRRGGIFGLLVGLWIVVIFGQIAFRNVEAIAHYRGASLKMVGAAEVALLWLATLLLTLANGELAKPDWDLEWLVTLPVRLPVLLGLRVIERAVICPTAWFFLLPFLFAWSERAGFGLASAGWVAAAGLPLMLCLAAVQTVIDTGLKLTLAPARLRNLQALCNIAGAAALFLGMSIGRGGTWVVAISRFLPHAVLRTPVGLVLAVLSEPSAAVSWLLLIAEAVLVALAGGLVVYRMLRSGVVAHAGRESGRAAASAARPAVVAPGRENAWLGPIARRELRLLARDRTFLIQTLILPVVLTAAQFVFNASNGAFGKLSGHLDTVAAIAFAVTAYSLMFSAFQTLNSEGHALWILFSCPHALSDVLRDKAKLWASLALIYPLAVFAGYFWFGGTAGAPVMIAFALVLIGIPIATLVAVSLGVFACDPLATEVQRRVRPGYTYLYLMINSIYAFGLVAASTWQRLGIIVLSALLALALWQKASDHLPYLLDPTASPPARVSLSDGLMAAMFFFVLQIAIVLTASDGDKPTMADSLLAFGIAGPATWAVARFLFWWFGTSAVPRFLGPGVVRGVTWGIGGGLLVAAAGLLYLRGFASLFPASAVSPPLGAGDRWQLFLLGVLAAPLAEEFIFRGLIYGGLRRSRGPAVAAIASAALFALLHAPASCAPVFLVGIAAAAVYERCGLLLGPTVVHAVYNAIVLGVGHHLLR
jgi:membrane protease YdiL (CAAX protease family)